MITETVVQVGLSDVVTVVDLIAAPIEYVDSPLSTKAVYSDLFMSRAARILEPCGGAGEQGEPGASSGSLYAAY